jgi:amino acid adenylation domain-containing protein/non-ribosomal peptide synthase protein (TIGR01720 family)
MCKVRQRVLDAHRHADVPFERIVNLLAPKRDPSRTPLFQTMFALQNLPASVRLNAAEPLGVGNRETPFDLSVLLEQRGSGLAGLATYASDLFDRATVDRLIDRFVWTIEQALCDPEQSLSDLTPLRPCERSLRLEAARGAAAPAMADSLHGRVFSLADQLPDRPAVATSEASLSYGELVRQARAIAAALLRAQLAPEEAVVLSCPPGADLLAGMLGIMAAGGAYVPIDPEAPPVRRAQIIAASGARLALANSEIEGVRTLGFVQPDSSLPLPDVDPERLAYVLFTSGSTGQPKGVACRHVSVLNLLTDFDTRAPLHEAPRGSLWTGAIFDVSIYEIFSVLLRGGTVCPVPQAIRLMPAPLLKWLAQERITTAYLPSFVLADLASRLETDGDLGLERLLVGVEPILSGVLHRVRVARSGLCVVNGYGPTETTICATLQDISDDLPAHPDLPAPIGRPVTGAETHVLDKALRPVPIGVAGDLYVGGAGLARGYLGAPGLTAERFIPDALSGRPGARLYATGDRVKWRADGTLVFLGRRDFQIKLRGLRIEPSEIETALTRLPGINRAIVLHDKASNRLVGYVESSDPEAEESAIRDALTTFLPQAMTPSVIVVQTALPTLPSGKIDRAALPPLPDVSAKTRTLPRDETERCLASIWSQVLGRADVAREDNFFSLGGDSILAIQVASRAGAAGLSMTPGLLFRHQTLMALAAALAGTTEAQTGTERFAGETPLAPIQAWFFEQDFAGRNHWNQTALLASAERIDHAALHAALRHVAERHEALRTTFRNTEAGWVQVIADTPTPVPCDLVEAADDAEGSASCAALQASLNIEAGPLLRARILRLPEQDLLFLVAHHLIIDAQSWRLLGEELTQAYTALREDQAPKALGPVASPSAWISRLAHYSSRLSPDDLSRRRDTGPISALPLDNPAGSNSAAQEVVLVSKVSGGTLDDMAKLAGPHGIEAHFLCALGAVLSRWICQDSVIVDLERMGRPPLFEDLDITRSIGWFTALAPVALGAATGEAARRAMAARLRELPEGGLGHGIAWHFGPKGAGVAKLRPPVSVNYFGRALAVAPDDPFRPADLDVGPRRAAQSQRPYLLEVSAVWKPSAFEISWHYTSGCLHDTTVARLAAELNEMLSADHPDAQTEEPYDMTSILNELKLDL